MTVPFNDLGRTTPDLWQRARARVDRVIESGWVVLGNQVNEFERSFAEYLGNGTTIGVASGTDALELSLRALGVGAGSRVGLAANAGYYTSTALHALGAEPVFVDVAEGLSSPSADLVADLLHRQRLDAFVITHLYGVVCPDIVEIARMCKEAGVALVEDCSQAHGARRDGRAAGTFGDAAAFSFYPTKNLGALGDGGAVFTGNAECADRVRALRQYGWAGKYVVEMAGGRNSRLDELQAAILLTGLERLDEDNERRRIIVDAYAAAVPRAELLSTDAERAAWVGHLCVFAVDDRDLVRAELRARGVATEVHFPVPDHQQPVRGHSGRESLPNTEVLCGRVLSLPCFPAMTAAEVARVSEAIAQVLG
jgi:aminotransferase EvaB